jgi:hypothetical protein
LRLYLGASFNDGMEKFSFKRLKRCYLFSGLPRNLKILKIK